MFLRCHPAWRLRARFAYADTYRPLITERPAPARLLFVRLALRSPFGQKLRTALSPPAALLDGLRSAYFHFFNGLYGESIPRRSGFVKRLEKNIFHRRKLTGNADQLCENRGRTKEAFPMRTVRRFAALALAAALLTAAAIPVRAAEELHCAYLAGFPDGSVRPEAPVTRAQLAVIFSRLADMVQEPAEACTADVSAEHWACAAVSLVCRTELMAPEADGLFHPDAPVTGPELAWTLARLCENEAAAAVWPELSQGWAAQEISFAAGAGWVMGFDGQTFDADAPLSRAALVRILNGLLGRTPSSVEDLQIGMPVFSDNRDTEKWYFLPIQEAAVAHTAARAGTDETWTALG